jgi:MscS family membrane protein
MPGEKRYTTRRFHAVTLLVFALLASSQIAFAQAGAAVPAAKADAPKDALGRDTPRGTVLGFMRAARQGKDDIAPLYLDTALTGQDAVALAHKLYVVLDSRLPARLTDLSDQPEGRPDNPLKPDRDVLGTITTTRGPFDLAVERFARGKAAPVWLFSRETLSAVPDAYEEINLIKVDRFLPDAVAKPRIAGVRLFDWLAVLLVLPLCYRLLGVLNWLWKPVMALWRRRSGATIGQLPGLIRLALIGIAIRWILASIDLPLVERQLWTAISGLLLLAAAGWLLLLVNGVGERYVRRHMMTGGEHTSLLRLGRRLADVLVLAACVLVMLRYFGFDPTAALAGLGIGGIAVALAAQKTLENVIAGVSLIFDKALHVGDTLKLGEIVGTVDDIGLRSTFIRTFDRTIVSVPNGQIAAGGIEILSARDKFWFHHFVGLQYGTTADQMRSVLDGLQAFLVAHADVEAESVRARFMRVGASSLDIEIFAYVVAGSWEGFLEIQQALLLRVMEIVEASGTAIAIPSQTLHIANGRTAAGVQAAVTGT